jgi:hypothetical protein
MELEYIFGLLGYPQDYNVMDMGIENVSSKTVTIVFKCYLRILEFYYHKSPGAYAKIL